MPCNASFGGSNVLHFQNQPYAKLLTEIFKTESVSRKQRERVRVAVYKCKYIPCSASRKCKERIYCSHICFASCTVPTAPCQRRRLCQALVVSRSRKSSSAGRHLFHQRVSDILKKPGINNLRYDLDLNGRSYRGL